MSKGTLIEKRKQTVANKKTEGFMERNFPVYIILMFIMYPLAAIFSALTEGMYVFENFNSTFQSFPLSIFLTVLVVLFIEMGSIF